MGDIVLIVDNRVVRGQWPLARVVEVFHGTDGRVRSANVRTATNTLMRPIAKLCLLETVAESVKA
jgi:hypothetical protein